MLGRSPPVSSMERADMRLRPAGIVLILLLGGCSSGSIANGVPGSQSADFQNRAHVDRENPPLLYVSDTSSNVVSVYDPRGTNQEPISQITGLVNPGELWVSAHGDLYVTQTTQTITGYHQSETDPFVTLHDPNQPSGVCGDNRGTIYVTDTGTPSGGHANTVEVYQGGATDPTSQVVVPKAQYVSACALDHAGDLFVAFGYARTGASAVDELPAGKTTPIRLVSGLRSAYGIALTKSGNLLVIDDDASGYGSIRTYAPPYTGKPVGTFFVTGYGQIALNARETRVWLADVSSALAQEYSYPSGRFVDSTSGLGLKEPYGIAVWPPDIP
jgi:hypothetical protein